MKRRNFLTTSAAAGAALFAGIPQRTLFALGKDNTYRANIGIQLYTLRNQLKGDVAGTIKAVAEAGYKQVEPYGFPDDKRIDLINASRDAGLAVNSSHFNWDSVVNPDDKGVEAFESILTKAKNHQLTHLVVPYLTDRNRKTLDDYRKVAENCNKRAEMAKAAGIQLAYHNHSFEFSPKGDDGKCGYDILVEEFSPDMKFEVDVFWIKAGGHDPAEMIRNLKGRVSQLHLKDLKKDQKLPVYEGIPEDAFEELGDGNIPMEPILEAAADAGVAICHVEQDHSPDPIASIRKSADYLRSL